MIILVEENINIKINRKNLKWYQDKGYICKINDIITIKNKDLTEGSNLTIKILCDYCLEDGRETVVQKKFYAFIKQNKRSLIHKDSCENCKSKKIQDTWTLKYGQHPMQNKDLRKKVSDKQRHSYDFVQNEFKKANYTLLTETYSNNQQKLEYICHNHQDKGVQKITFGNFMFGQRCKYCHYDKLRKEKQFDFEFVKLRFNEKNLTLLEKDYKNARTKMKFKCNIYDNIIQQTTFTQIQHRNGDGCIICSYEKRSGENHHYWKGGISTLYDYLRKKTLDKWRYDSMKENGFKCIITGDKDFIVHHLYSYSTILQETLDELGLPVYKELNNYTKEELNNLADKCIEIHYRHPLGVCINRSLHMEFHQKYGTENNTPEQFEEFYKSKIL